MARARPTGSYGRSARSHAPRSADAPAPGLAAVWADVRRRSYFLAAPASRAATARHADNAAQRLTAALRPATCTLTPATAAGRKQPGQHSATAAATLGVRGLAPGVYVVRSGAQTARLVVSQ